MLKIEIENSLKVLKEGGIILYPTDTIWGLGCDATNEDAIKKINNIKNRSQDKRFIVLLDTDVKLQTYLSDVPEIAYDLIEYADDPLTIIFSGARNLAKNAINEDGTVAIRIVKHEFCQQLILRFKKPITSTSANLSGQPAPKQFKDISENILDAVDYVVNWEQELSNTKNPSTIMKLDINGQFSFIRK